MEQCLARRDVLSKCFCYDFAAGHRKLSCFFPFQLLLMILFLFSCSSCPDFWSWASVPLLCISHGENWVVEDPEGEADQASPGWRPQESSGEGEDQVEEVGILVRRS